MFHAVHLGTTSPTLIRWYLRLAIMLSLLACNTAFGLGDASYIDSSENGGVRIADGVNLASLQIDAAGYKGLRRAASDLQKDIEWVKKAPVGAFLILGIRV